MSGFPTPLRDAFAPALSERDKKRLWRAITDRRTARVQRAAERRSALAGAALGVVCLLVAAIWPRRTGSEALSLADGRDLAVLEIPPVAADDTALADGSHVARERGTRLRVLESTASVVDMLIEGGQVRFRVQKGGPRRWIVECGLLSAEVVGTEFVVERDLAHARVEVIEGAVLVRGERVPDRVKRLGAGESVEVRTEASALAPTWSASPGLIPPSSTSSSVIVGQAAPGPAPAEPANTDSWRDLARSAAYDRAYETLGEGGIARTSVGASVDVLIELADVARHSGHPNEAIAPLTEIADKHTGDPRAPNLVFTLGSVLLDRAPLLAAQRFEQVVAAGRPVSLVEDAMAHVVEARARAGDQMGARAAAARYESAYPSGAWRQAVRRWVSP
jgi:transmembrane sensor